MVKLSNSGLEASVSAPASGTSSSYPIIPSKHKIQVEGGTILDVATLSTPENQRVVTIYVRPGSVNILSYITPFVKDPKDYRFYSFEGIQDVKRFDELVLEALSGIPEIKEDLFGSKFNLNRRGVYQHLYDIRYRDRVLDQLYPFN